MPYIELDGDVRPLGPGVLTIGSAPEAGWRVQGRGLEPVHLLLSVQTGARALLIRGTPGATVQVNGVDLVASRTLLSFGDRVCAGGAEFRYRRLAPGHEAPTAYLRDTRRGRLYQLRDRSTIGRDVASTVVIHEPDVSRLHAELLQRGEAYLIVAHGVSVTSVNGVRLIAPTVLQEGDEIAIGRTVLRFTTALPMGAPIDQTLGHGARPAPARYGAAVEPTSRAARPGHRARESRAQTTFMGAIEAREQRSRVTRRRLTRFAAVAVVSLAMAAVVVSLYADAHSAGQSGASSRVVRRGLPGARRARLTSTPTP